MGRIAAGIEFGQAVAEPVRTQSGTDPTGGALALADAASRSGAQQEGEARTLTLQDAAAREHLISQAAADKALLERRQLHERDQLEGAQAQAKMLLLRDRLADTLGAIDTEVQEGRLQKEEASKAWKERTAAAIAEGMDGVPESRRQFVQMDAEGLSMRLASKVGDIVRRRDRTDAHASLGTTLEYTERLAVHDPAKARYITETALDAVGPLAGMAPDQIQKTKQGWVERTAYTRGYAAVNGARADNKALGVVEQSIVSDEDLDPQRKATLLAEIGRHRANNDARALRLAQHAELAAQKRQRESDAAFKVLSTWAMSGKVPAADDKANAALIAKLTPEDAAAYRAMAAEVPARTAAAMLPLSTQQEQLDGLYAMRAQQGTSQRLEAEIARREHVLAESRRDYTADPLRAAEERGLLDTPLQPLRMDSLDAIAAGIVQRVSQAQSAETRVGRPVSPLLAREAARFGDLLATLPPSQRADRIAQMSKLLPPGMAHAMAAQIAPKDRALALQFAAGASQTTQGRYTAELIARGAQAVKDKEVKEEMGAETGLRSTIAKEVGDAVSGQAREDVIEAARLIYLGKHAMGESIDAANATRIAVGGQIIEHNGRRIPVPNGVDMRESLMRYSRASIERQAPDGWVYLAGRRPMGVPEFLGALPEAQLEAVGFGRYMVRSGGSMVLDSKSRPIVIDVVGR